MNRGRGGGREQAVIPLCVEPGIDAERVLTLPTAERLDLRPGGPGGKQRKALKAAVVACAKTASATCGAVHRERRVYARLALSTLRWLVAESPGLLGPKFPVVLAALSVASAEVLWLLRHQRMIQPGSVLRV